MDFVHDQLADGHPFRVLTVVDQWSRFSPVLSPARSIRGADVARVLDQAIGTGLPPPLDHRGSRDRVHLPGPGGLGLPARRPVGFHATGQAHGQRAHRGVQRPPA